MSQNQLNAFKALAVSPQVKRIMGNTGWLLLEQAISMGLAFVSSVLVIRYLGPGSLGIYSYGLSLVAIVGVLAKLGLDAIVIRQLIDLRDMEREVLGTALLLKVLAGLLAIMAITGLVFCLNNGHLETVTVTFVLAISLLFQALDVVNFWYQSQTNSRPMAIVRVATAVLLAGMRVMLVVLEFPLIAFAATYSIEALVRAIGMAAYYQWDRRTLQLWTFSKQKALGLLGDSWPLMLSGAMAIIYMKIDQIMLASMTGAAEVGIYAAAVRFSEVWYIVPMAITSSLFPAIIRLKQSNPSALPMKMQKIFDLMAWLALAIALATTLASSLIVEILLGSAYKASAAILTLHIWAGVFIFLETARSRWLIVQNQTRFQLVTTTIGAAMNIGLNLILIPRYMGLGAAVATLVSYAIAVVLSCFFYRPTRELGWQLLKATFVPLRFADNLEYVKSLRLILTKPETRSHHGS